MNALLNGNIQAKIFLTDKDINLQIAKDVEIGVKLYNQLFDIFKFISSGPEYILFQRAIKNGSDPETAESMLEKIRHSGISIEETTA